MRLIAHRGLFNGESPKEENNPSQIDLALEHGFDCEIDLRVENNKLFLGHDEPVHEIDQSWLDLRASKLWIHCKNLGALNHLLGQKSDLNFFWHQEDDYTLTSAGVIWTYPGIEFNNQCVIVVLELIDLLRIKMGDEGNLFGVCSKYVGLI